MPILHPVRTYLAALDDRSRRYPFVAQAVEFSREGYASLNLKRKYTGENYSVHTDEVGGILAYYGRTNEEVVGGVNHDIVEDINQPPYNLAGIIARFGPVAAGYVYAVTNLYTRDRYPNMNRRNRKIAEHSRLSNISPEAKGIKLADMVSNLRKLKTLDPNFWEVYSRETAFLAPLLSVPSDPMNVELTQIVRHLLSTPQLPCSLPPFSEPLPPGSDLSHAQEQMRMFPPSVHRAKPPPPQ